MLKSVGKMYILKVSPPKIITNYRWKNSNFTGGKHERHYLKKAIKFTTISIKPHLHQELSKIILIKSIKSMKILKNYHRVEDAKETQ